MSVDENALDALADAVHRAHDPAGKLAEAVSAVFTERPQPQRAASDLSLRLADGLAAHRAHRARLTAKYGDLDELAGRLMARGLSARVWS